jgi:SAM-dependent methyltransferase
LRPAGSRIREAVVRKVFRFEDNDGYWNRRWSQPGEDAARFSDMSIYPIRFAEMVVADRRQKILEVGAGLGRVLKHYHYQGFDISGVERSAVAVNRIRATDASIRIEHADAGCLPFADSSFDVVLAFGVFHNIEEGLSDALAETARSLRRGGRFAISMRPDNLEMRFNEWYWRRQHRAPAGGEPQFHKWLVTADEFRGTLARAGLVTSAVHRARNVSLLYRVPALRQASADEGERRSSGYRLNTAGRVLDRVLVGAFPHQFCNVLVFIGDRR